MLPQKRFIQYIHNFRGLAIILIVLGHMLVFLDMSEYPLINSTLRIFGSNGSTYFIFIAGFIFQLLSHKYKYKDYLKNKFFNVVVPYVVVSVPAICLCIIRNQTFFPSMNSSSFGNWHVLHKIVYLYLTGSHFFHFWFVPMIIVFYFFAPIFIYLDQYSKYYKTFLPFLICLSFVVPRANDDTLVLQNFIHFLSVYTLGMFCSHYENVVLGYMEKYWQWILILAIILIASEIILVNTFSSSINTTSLNTTSKSILSLVVMYLLWKYGSSFPVEIHTILGRFADLSFGIYFLHAYIIYVYLFVLKYMNISIGKNIIFWAFSACIVIVINIFILLASQRILQKKSKYLFGC